MGPARMFAAVLGGDGIDRYAADRIVHAARVRPSVRLAAVPVREALSQGH
jgi:hypothetical protein